MKKIIILSIAFCSLFITGCGCNKKEMKTVTCKLNKTYDIYEYSTVVTITYDGETGIVTNVLEEEKIFSGDKQFLQNVKTLDEGIHEIYNDVKHITYENSIDEDSFYKKFEIDYSKVDLNKLLELDYSKSQFVINGNVIYSDIIKSYEDNDILCN